jgi:hypothetical protein
MSLLNYLYQFVDRVWPVRHDQDQVGECEAKLKLEIMKSYNGTLIQITALN